MIKDGNVRFTVRFTCLETDLEDFKHAIEIYGFGTPRNYVRESVKAMAKMYREKAILKCPISLEKI